jgi:hypothetical protein
MSKYLYKGIDISNLIITGSTTVSGYTDFLSYTPASNYSSERPIPFNYYTPKGQLSDLMRAKFVDFDSGSGNYTIPSDFDSVRIILLGGGGGGGGGGGCGWKSGSSLESPSTARTSGQYGLPGDNGSYTFTSTDIKLSSQNIYYSVGTLGDNGTAGGDKAKTSIGPGGKGNNGYRGNESMVTINVDGINYNIYANGGYGGAGGDSGGPGSAQGDPRQPGPAFTNNYPGIVDYSNGRPSSVNPINYLQFLSQAGSGGQKSDYNLDSNPGNQGNPGKIRIYLLKS